MKPGEKVIVMPSGVAGEIKSIETHHTQYESAEAGDNVGFNLRGVDKKQIKRGDIIRSRRQSAIGCQGVRGPSDRDSPSHSNRSGYTPVLHAHTAQVGRDNLAVHLKIDPRTGATTERNPKFLKTGDAAIVRIKPVRPLPIETFKDFPEIGRFALARYGTTIGAGVALGITEKARSKQKVKWTIDMPQAARIKLTSTNLTTLEGVCNEIKGDWRKDRYQVARPTSTSNKKLQSSH